MSRDGDQRTIKKVQKDAFGRNYRLLLVAGCDFWDMTVCCDLVARVRASMEVISESSASETCTDCLRL